MNQQVAFRRIHGRVVPIRLNKSQSEQLKGAAIAGAGIGLASGSGALYRKAIWAGTKASVRAFDTLHKVKSFRSAQPSLFGYARKLEMEKKAAELFRTGVKLQKYGTIARKVGTFGGAGLVAYGVHRALKARGDEHPGAKALVAGAALPVANEAFKAGALGRAGLKDLAFKSFNFLKTHVSKVKF